MLAANDVVSFDDRGDPDVRSIFILSLVDADDASMSANEDLGAAGDFGRQCERKVELGTRRQVSLHSKIHAAC